MAQIITGKFPRQLNVLSSINKQGWLVFQPNEVDDEAFGVQLQTIIDEIGDLPAVAVVYNDVSELLADQSNQESGILYRVADPIADPAFADLPINEIRATYYHFRGTATGSVNDYTVIAIPKLQSDANPKLGANLDAGAFFINVRAPEWTGIEASVRALNNALNLNSPEDISLTPTGSIIMTPDNRPGSISRVLIGLDGHLIFEPFQTAKLLSDSDNSDHTLSSTYVDTGLSITPTSAINRGVIEAALSLKSVVSGSITAFADAGNGRLRVTSSGHGRAAGQYVTISGTTNYNGTYQIKQAPNVNDFDITKAFVATETGTWEQALSSEVEIDLRVNSVSVETFTRDIRGTVRTYISRQITTALNASEAIQIFARSNGTDIELIGATTASELRIVDTEEDGGGGHVIQEEGTSLTQRANLNFIGSGVTAADDSGNDATTVTISGGGGGPEINAWYVKKGGNDTTGDGSPQTPFLTIAHAISQASNNDVIYIGPGSYSETITLTKSLNFVGGVPTDSSNIDGTTRNSQLLTLEDASNESTFTNMHLTGGMTFNNPSGNNRYQFTHCHLQGTATINATALIEVHFNNCTEASFLVNLNNNGQLRAIDSNFSNITLNDSTCEVGLMRSHVDQLSIGGGEVFADFSTIGTLDAFTGRIAGFQVGVRTNNNVDGDFDVVNPWPDKLDVVSVVLNAGAFTLNQDSKLQRVFQTLTTITANATASLQNGVSGSVFSWYIQVTGTVVLDFTASTQTVYCDAEGWNSANKDLTITGGTDSRFELAGLYVNGAWNLKVSQEFE